MINIAASKRGQVEDIVNEILRKWLKGGGKTHVTWETLILVLRNSGLETLADDVNNTFVYCLLVYTHKQQVFSKFFNF